MKQEGGPAFLSAGHDGADPHDAAWYSLSDPAMEEPLIGVPTMSSFAGIELISDQISYCITFISSSHVLEKHELGQAIFGTNKDNIAAWPFLCLRDPSMMLS